MIEELSKHIVERAGGKEWYAGEQLDALKFYSDEAIAVLVEAKEGGYQGECGAILFCEGKLFLWRDSFGSCSGCDGLEGKDAERGYEYILKTLTSVKEFNNPFELISYLNDKYRDYLYGEDVSKKLVISFSDYLERIGANLNPKQAMEIIIKSIVLNKLK